jgi:hypothetical protein
MAELKSRGKNQGTSKTPTLRYPRSEPDCMTWLPPDQPHIRSSRKATAPRSRLRRVELRKTKPFSGAAFQARDCGGSPTWIRQDRSGPGRFEEFGQRLLSVGFHRSSFDDDAGGHIFPQCYQ